MRSMTAYACVSKKRNAHVLQVTIRSLNFKYLDISIHNLSHDKIFLEEKIKKEIKKKINRGRIEIYVFSKGPVEGRIRINERLLFSYVKQLKHAAKKCKINSEIGVRDVLHLPQLVHLEEEKASDENLILQAVKEGLAKLMDFKRKEGRLIKREIFSNLKKINENVEKIKILKPKVFSEEERKEDIDEEISLMSFYINKLEQSISSDVPVLKGKTVDFLTQEILRELNASSSKTKRKKIASLIVDAKSYLERIREQAQNIE